MQKTIIIGIGGTGLQAIRELRRLIAERYEQGLKAPEVASVKFIYIDTDANDIGKYSWNVLGKDISLTPAEKVIITGDRLGGIVKNQENYAEIDAWLPVIKDFVGDPGPGAKGIRPYGRLIYEYAENKQKIQRILTDTRDALDQEFQNQGQLDWRFYLVCGLSGGTGSGMFLPLSFDLIEWNLFQRGTQDKFYSFLVLPPLAVTGRHPRYHANAFASLKELNYYPFTSQGSPYNNCYLVEPKNVTLESLPLLIAQRLFLNIQGSNAASEIDGIMDNVGDGGGNAEIDPITGDKHAFCFSTFGISSVAYPKETVYQCLAYQVAFSVISSWNNPTDYPQNVNEKVKAGLQVLHLSKSHCLGDSDRFGSLLQNSYEVEIENQVEENLRSVVNNRQLAINAERIRKEVEDGFRGKGFNGYYTQLLADVQGAVNVATRETQTQISDLLVSPQFGLVYCIRYIEELIKILNEYKEEFSTNSSEHCNQAINRARNILSVAIDSVRKKESSMIYLNFERDRSEIKNKLNNYLKVFADYRANLYGLEFVTKVLIQLVTLQNQLNTWNTIINNLTLNLQGKLNNLLDELSNSTQENGRVIFNRNGLEQLLEQVDLATIKENIEGRLALWQKSEKLDLTQLFQLQVSELEKVFHRIAYEWVETTGAIDINSISLYDKFINQYPDSDERRVILTNAKNLSSSLLRFQPSEVQLGDRIIPGDTEIATIPSFTQAQVQVGTNNQPNNVIIKNDLKAVGVFRINEGDDEDRITFIKETKAFPLRFIESLRFLQTQYQQFSFKEALHINKTFVGELYNLYLFTTQQYKAQIGAEEVFVLARAIQSITHEKNQSTNKKDVVYQYQDLVLSGKQRCVLGNNWDNALEKFVEDAVEAIVHPNVQSDVRKARLKLETEYNKKCQDAKQNSQVAQEIQEQLKGFLSECLAEYVHDTDGRYERYQKIVNRIESKLFNEE